MTRKPVATNLVEVMSKMFGVDKTPKKKPKITQNLPKNMLKITQNYAEKILKILQKYLKISGNTKSDNIIDGTYCCVCQPSQST